jgi:release factor glutamine methyltransferase
VALNTPRAQILRLEDERNEIDFFHSTIMKGKRSNRRIPARVGYHPSFSPIEVERIREWHEKAYAELLDREITEVTYLGRSLKIMPRVFPVTPMSDLLGNAVLNEVRPDDRVLDMGTGCGVNAILAASRSSDVVGVDVNPHAINCARDNAETNGVATRIDFHQSDVFQHVEGTFDLIVFDPPFRWFAPRDEVEAAIADENYGALTRFMQEAPSHLRQGGRILLFFGSSGDLAYVFGLIDRSGMASEVVAERQLERDERTIRYYVYRLTAPAASGHCSEQEYRFEQA